jgi:hypothetical protein
MRRRDRQARNPELGIEVGFDDVSAHANDLAAPDVPLHRLKIL